MTLSSFPGHIKRITDPDIQSFVLEIVGTNVSTTYITCPADPRKTLGIKLPYLVMIVKNMKKYFTFEVQVDSNNFDPLSNTNKFSWCSGYHIRLTRGRSPVQSRAKTKCFCTYAEDEEEEA